MLVGVCFSMWPAGCLTALYVQEIPFLVVWHKCPLKSFLSKPWSFLRNISAMLFKNMMSCLMFACLWAGLYLRTCFISEEYHMINVHVGLIFVNGRWHSSKTHCRFVSKFELLYTTNRCLHNSTIFATNLCQICVGPPKRMLERKEQQYIAFIWNKPYLRV